MMIFTLNVQPARGLVSLLIALSTALAGCGSVIGPGFDLMKDHQRKDGVPLGQYVPGNADRPPPGTITPITASLVQQMRPAAPANVPAEVAALFGKAEPYRIGVTDSLNITVYGHPELAAPAVTFVSNDPSGLSGGSGFTVNALGEIIFPFVGKVKLAGLTEAEALELLQNRLGRYLKDPQVGLRVATFRSRRTYVDGEVRVPGVQIMNDVPMTLPELLFRAGGVTPVADRSQVAITRARKTTFVNIAALTEQGHDLSQILLQPNDLVRVFSREDTRVYVMGEVARPTAMPMRNGRLSLNEALGDAGGVNATTANPRQIYVIRTGADNQAQIYHLDARNAASLVLADAFPLRPRDVVYVDAVPLVVWNRIISLILPSAQAAVSTRSLVTP